MDSSRVRFAGYAAIFDRPDKGGDVIRPGAFAGSLGSGEAVPLLWQHKAGAVIGRIEHRRYPLRQAGLSRSPISKSAGPSWRCSNCLRPAMPPMPRSTSLPPPATRGCGSICRSRRHWDPAQLEASQLRGVP